MDVVISVLIILCCVILILAILIQNPKGGGLASGFQGGAQVMGVRRTADFLEKASWTLAVLLFIFSIWATSRVKKPAEGGSSDAASMTKDRAGDFNKTAPANTAMPSFPQGGGNAPAPPAPAGGATPKAPPAK